MANSSTTESILRIRAENATGAALQQISRDLDRVGRDAARAGGHSMNAATAVQRMLGGLTGFQRQIGAAAVSFGSGLVTRKAVVEFADLERSITSLHHTLGIGTEGIDDTRKKIFELALGTGQSADKVVQAYQTIAAAGGTNAEETDKLAQMSAKAALAMDANIDETAKMGVLYKMAGNDMAGVERMFARVTSASQKGRFEGKDFAAHFEEINLIMQQLGYTGDEGLNKVLALLTRTRTSAASSADAVANLRDETSKFMSPETFANFKKFGGADLWNENDARRAKAAGKDLGMMFIQASKLLIAKNAAKGKPITVQDILQDVQARGALFALTNDVGELKKLFKEFEDTDLTINDKQFQDKMGQARAAVDNFETKLTQLRTSLGKGLVDAGALDLVNSLAGFLERAGIGAERLGAAVRHWREGRGTAALKKEINENFSALVESKNSSAVEDLRSRRKLATTDAQRSDIDKMIDTMTDKVDAERKSRGLPMSYPAPLDPSLRNYGPDNVPPPKTSSGIERVRPRMPGIGSNTNDLGTASEATARQQVEEQRKTNEAIGRLLMSPISYGGSAGDAGGSTGGGINSRSFGGGRFNGLGGSGGGDTPDGSGDSVGGGRSGAPARGGRYSTGEMAQIALRNGATPREAAILGAIAQAESGGNARAHNPYGRDNSYGLWQINMLGAMGPQRRAKYGLKSNEDLWNPDTNAKVAIKMMRANGGFRDWSTYTSGAYRRHVGAATAGAQSFKPDSTTGAPGASATTAPKTLPGGGENLSRLPDDKVVPPAGGVPRATPEHPVGEPAPVKVPVTFDYQGVEMQRIRDRGVAQARREMDRDIRSARYTTYSDVGVAALLAMLGATFIQGALPWLTSM